MNPSQRAPHLTHPKRRLGWALRGLLTTAALLGLVLAAAVGFGGPGTPPPMASINSPFATVNRDGMPAPSRYAARDGKLLAYRAYPSRTGDSGSSSDRSHTGGRGASAGTVVLVHGSSASSTSMHTLAAAYAEAGFTAYALDMRGHGDSDTAPGRKGQVDYIGQLEDDVEDLLRAVRPAAPATLVGFSSGGGFVLRFAASNRQGLFQSYLLMSPFLSQDSPTQRPASGGWANVGVPRVVALTLLNRLGITAFERLPVVRFALDEASRPWLTPEYGFALATNFRPKSDYLGDIAAAMRPTAVLAGADDEAFFTERLQATVKSAGKDWPVQLLPGIGHVALTLDANAVAAAVQAVRVLQGTGR